ncbi:Transcriptional repressor scratch 1-like protein [Dinothrombium tinctorium]|uniref:Transcriptional repressor scratch 1-like protein n=1 Tax=Dinothrombium tinctorium TaxID=1965070 RepID=A0A3S3PB95_9ACAR|nr:Transcriptional repressor scratch 1-like protein [Dinothrombium tinctorium]RWS06345.1 Transcriptional repressor scratch 1-like protein [Dinothrombium tinctorium]RWS11806.1 Transcriptional repressor scratch 1-like protein [Dinothrombium tinctorium]
MKMIANVTSVKMKCKMKRKICPYAIIKFTVQDIPTDTPRPSPEIIRWSIAISDAHVEYLSIPNTPESVDGFNSNVCDSHMCPDCGKRYSTSSNLARHRQTHRSVTDKKARKCPHCDKVYVSMPAYSMHVRTHSQGCQCPYCGKCFSRPWLLQGHIRTHTGEKPFKCPICAKAFADKSNLRAHIQTHSTTKPYSCQRCGKAFALKSYLYKHEESSCMRMHKHGSAAGHIAYRNVSSASSNKN